MPDPRSVWVMSPNEGHDHTAASTVAEELSGLIDEIEEYVEEKVAPILETFDEDASDRP